MQIGRVSVAECDEWSEGASGVVRTGGLLHGDTSAELSIQRQQILGLASGDEWAVPVTMSHDPDRDGWYRVLDVDVEHVLGMTETRGERRWSATLQRLEYGVQPRIELRRKGALRANTHSLNSNTANAIICLPGTATAIDIGATGGTYTRTNRDLAVATKQVARIAEASTSTLYDHIVSARVPLADAYVGAARLEVDVTGSGDWRTVVGREVDEQPTAWRLSNDLFRVSYSTTSLGFVAELWTGAAWQRPNFTRFQLMRGTTAAFALVHPAQIRVLYNGPERVTLRLIYDDATNLDRVAVDLTLLRGRQHIEASVFSRVAAQWGIGANENTSLPDVTNLTSNSGLRRTDADSNTRWGIASPQTITLTSVSTTRIIHLTTAANRFNFGFGLGTGAVTSESGIVTEMNAYFAPVYDSVRPSGL
jgi:hypothetical protein